QASMPRTGSITALPIAMPMLRKNCSLPAMKARLCARVSAPGAWRAKCGASARSVSAEQRTEIVAQPADAPQHLVVVGAEAHHLAEALVDHAVAAIAERAVLADH